MENLLGSIAVPEPFSLEIAGDAAGVTLLARCREGSFVKQQLGVHYPQARVSEVPPEDDPVRTGPPCPGPFGDGASNPLKDRPPRVGGACRGRAAVPWPAPIEHTEGVHHFMAALTRQAKRHSGFQVLQVSPPHHAARYFRHRGRLRSIHPDGFGVAQARMSMP